MVINHFDKFPLKTNKLKDYISFKKAYYIIKNKEHLTKQGLDKLTSIKSSMNLGLSPELKLAFPNINTSLIKEPNIIYSSGYNHNTKDGNIKANILNFDPNWISGFASGEFSFCLRQKQRKWILEKLKN